MAKCKSCKGNINWIKTPRGKHMPVNQGAVQIRPPQVDQDVVKIVTRDGEIVEGTPILDGDVTAYKRLGENVQTGFIPHWSNCPFAKSHRKRR